MTKTTLSILETRIVNDELSQPNEGEIKYKLTQALIHELYKSNKIKFTSKFDSYNGLTVYKAEMWTSSNKFTNDVVHEDTFHLRGEIFTKKDVELALQKTFPYRLI